MLVRVRWRRIQRFDEALDPVGMEAPQELLDPGRRELPKDSRELPKCIAAELEHVCLLEGLGQIRNFSWRAGLETAVSVRPFADRGLCVDEPAIPTPLALASCALGSGC